MEPFHTPFRTAQDVPRHLRLIATRQRGRRNGGGGRHHNRQPSTTGTNTYLDWEQRRAADHNARARVQHRRDNLQCAITLLLVLASVGLAFLLGCGLLVCHFAAHGTLVLVRGTLVPAAAAALLANLLPSTNKTATTNDTMDDNNLAVVLALVLITLVVAFAAFMATKWMELFTPAMAQAREADRAEEDGATTTTVAA